MEQKSRHGDPFDYPDIPGKSGLPPDYLMTNMPAHMKSALAEGEKRRIARLAGKPDAK